MNVLALDTSTVRGSAALLHKGKPLVGVCLVPHLRAVQTLAPTIQALLKQQRWDASQVELIGVSVGPGSFTGLRLGVTTAKVLAWAAGAEVLGVDTLEAIAWGVPGTGTLHVAMDAQRQEVFAATFQRQDSQQPWQCSRGLRLLKLQQWLQCLRAGEKVAGPVLHRCQAALPPGVVVCPPCQWYPWAWQVGALAWHRWQQGQRQDVWSLVPRYYRPSPGQQSQGPSGPG